MKPNVTLNTEFPDGVSAATKRHWCGYRSDCVSCRARLIAGGPQYFASELACKILPEYKVRLETMGASSIQEAHKLCREWRDKLDSMFLDLMK